MIENEKPVRPDVEGIAGRLSYYEVDAVDVTDLLAYVEWCERDADTLRIKLAAAVEDKREAEVQLCMQSPWWKIAQERQDEINKLKNQVEHFEHRVSAAEKRAEEAEARLKAMETQS